MDGVEYRLLTEITKGWNIKYELAEIDSQPQWKNNLMDINHNKSDLGLCSIWLHAKHATEYDLTTYINTECITLLLPKPIRLSMASAIYLTFNKFVWTLWLSGFLLTGSLLTLMSRNGFTKRNSVDIFSDLSRSILETLNTATSHGASKLSNRSAVNVLLMR